MTRRSGVDVAAMLRLIDLTDYIVPHTIRSAAELGIADALAGGPRTVAEIAIAVRAEPAALLRALRALACNGIFTELPDGRFGLTELARLLATDHPYSVRGMLPLMPAELYAWAGLHETMRTGQPAFPRVHGKPWYDYLSEHPEDRARYDAGQRDLGRLELRAVRRAYPWHDLDHVVDVGGGTGAFLEGLFDAYPRLRGTLVDVPTALDQVTATDRMSLCPADITVDPLPRGADAYVLKRVLCAVPDPVAVLGKVREAMASNSRVLVLEPLREVGRKLDPPALVDLFQLVFTGGQVRTLDELTDLFDAAGLRLAAVHSTALFPIVEAVAA
jgi:hypothetical protein